MSTHIIPFNDLSLQYTSIKNEIDHAVSDVLESGQFIGGRNLRAFENEFAAFCGVPYAVGVGSGTEAIHLALLTCGVQPGDEVITVPNTAVPTGSAISFSNAIPIFIDIDRETYTMDPNRLEDYLKIRNRNDSSKKFRRIKVILPVHLYGHPADMGSILDIAGRFEIRVVEDACQGHGSLFKGKVVGTLADFGAFSFYPTKNLGAYGDGGMVVSRDKKSNTTLLRLRNHGEDKKFHSVIKGFNSRLDEIQAAILRVKLNHLNDWNEKRRKLARLYNRVLKDSSVITPTEKRFAKHNYHLYVIRSERRDELKEWLESKKIGVSIHYPIPIHLQPAFLDLGYKRGDFLVTEQIAEEILSLPMYAELQTESVNKVAETIKEFIA